MGRFSGSLFMLLVAVTICCGYINGKILTNSYLIEFNTDTDRATANAIASQHGFVSLGPVCEPINFFGLFLYIANLR